MLGKKRQNSIAKTCTQVFSSTAQSVVLCLRKMDPDLFSGITN